MPTSNRSLLQETVDGTIGVVTLNRPSSLNALTAQLMQDLEACISKFDEDPSIRCIVVTGSGERAFSAGGDLHELAAMTQDEAQQHRERWMASSWRIANSRKPTIGAINGLAFGAGAHLATILDLRIGCERTEFRFNAASAGQMSSTWSLPALVGWGAAKELLYSGRPVHADESERIGLLNSVVPSGRLLEAARAMGSQIAANKPEIVQSIKQLMQSGIGTSWMSRLDAEMAAGLTTARPSDIADGFADFFARKGRRS
jgi:enoyl-CoA hydratase/carnithine racemase